MSDAIKNVLSLLEKRKYGGPRGKYVSKQRRRFGYASKKREVVDEGALADVDYSSVKALHKKMSDHHAELAHLARTYAAQMPSRSEHWHAIAAVHSKKAGNHQRSLKRLGESVDEGAMSVRFHHDSARTHLYAREEGAKDWKKIRSYEHRVEDTGPIKKKIVDHLKTTGTDVRVAPDTHSVNEEIEVGSMLDRVLTRLRLDEGRGRPRKHARDNGSTEQEDPDVHPIVQLRKAVSLRGQHDVTFQHGPKAKVKADHARYALDKHDTLQGDARKGWAARIGHSHKEFVKAIRESLTEEVDALESQSGGEVYEDEQIDELKKSTLLRYVKKSVDSAGLHAADIGKIGLSNGDGKKSLRAYTKRTTGIRRAAGKLATQTEEVQINELTGKTLGSYIQKAHADAEKKGAHYRELMDHPSVKKITAKRSELYSRKKYDRHGRSVHRKSIDATYGQEGRAKTKLDPNYLRNTDSGKRRRGIEKAVKRLESGKLTKD